uniref:Saposin B-type domain-containing protein n=1 Tax=Ditylenchus dipsaci TaxID=166011 RepID=A0A915DCX4_9BILA
MIQKNATREKIVETAESLCVNFADKDPAFCSGMIAQFKDSFFYVAEQSVLKPSQLCAFIFPDCGTASNPFNGGNWDIDLPPKPSNLPPKISITVPQKTFRVLQLSDLHFDFSYTPGSEADCKLPICCQTSIPLTKPNKPAGYWGTLASCDLPWWTIENMLQHINKTEKIDYIMLTGDYMSHRDWTYTRQGHLEVIANLSATMTKYFPSTPVFYTLGNHEGVPVDSFPPHFAPAIFQPEWMYRAIYSAGEKWLPPQANESAIYRGSYSLMVTQDLKLISVNTGKNVLIF